MKWHHILILLCILTLLIGGIVYTHKDRAVMMKYPPASLAYWYKPENKRQVWLHNMFKLRREMQAVRYYATNKNHELLEKWSNRLSEHYLKIGKMVPEWKKKLYTGTIEDLQQSVKNKQYKEVLDAAENLGKSCKSCHRDYRMITATMYRAPDFSSLTVGDSTYIDYMKLLMQQVNHIKIASDDGIKDTALSNLKDLKKGIDDLGKTCVNCHKQDKQVYPNATIKSTIMNLEQSLLSGTPKEQGKELGTLAVLACARCHGTHRLSYDARDGFTNRQSWSELIKH